MTSDGSSMPASPRTPGRASPALTLKIRAVPPLPASGGGGGLRIRLGKQGVAAKRKRTSGGGAGADSPMPSPGPLRMSFKNMSPVP